MWKYKLLEIITTLGVSICALFIAIFIWIVAKISS